MQEDESDVDEGCGPVTDCRFMNVGHDGEAGVENDCGSDQTAQPL